ncbi:hypothetical protein PHYSODRAFT_261472 [Phytophthora sojae]|uniref:BZIP domain-containing protein n=1 Tax=Phytophthora sojae (strain P6497) TaxID=1094619 RepID=G4ZHJ2_PHYSP|nr:hypothetical protein PHYSODRAFT_261472 [Phytophthora sojae]EGZ18072.1 hypothetical protein PHYSODRAFT_261472 [Phytophthora sojae]|eukprot:XP_009527130.1 hypothetical protein PHYSODRAFT_261472 [Phytophthora sojae]
MSSSFLYPRDSYLLSDRRGAVPHNSGPLHSRLGLTDEHDSREVQRYTKPRQTYPTESSPSLVGRKRLPDVNPLADTSTKLTAGRTLYRQEEEPVTPPTNDGRAVKAAATRRERCRINQARYRQRQRQYAENLDASLNALREEIQALELRRQSILRCAPTNESAWVVAMEYFRLFRYGFMAPMMVPGVASSSEKRSTSSPPEQTDAQLDFLKATMASDVTDGDATGPDALLRHWRLFSMVFDDVHLQLKRMEQIEDDSLLALSSISITITEKTLRYVFPPLNPTIAKKLLKQRLVVRGSSRFDWDESCGRVIRLESKLDLLSPLLQLLGNLEDVATVFENAQLTPEGRFISGKK